MYLRGGIWKDFIFFSTDKIQASEEVKQQFMCIQKSLQVEII